MSELLTIAMATELTETELTACCGWWPMPRRSTR